MERRGLAGPADPSRAQIQMRLREMRMRDRVCFHFLALQDWIWKGIEASRSKAEFIHDCCMSCFPIAHFSVRTHPPQTAVIFGCWRIAEDEKEVLNRTSTSSKANERASANRCNPCRRRILFPIANRSDRERSVATLTATTAAGAVLIAAPRIRIRSGRLHSGSRNSQL